MSRRARTAAALLAIVAMLFAPVALALHACPSAVDMLLEARAEVSMAAAMSDQVAPMTMDATLCEHHCNPNVQSSFDLAPPAVFASPPLLPALRVPALEPLLLRAPAIDSAFATAAGPAPPLIRYTVLRI